MGSLRGPVMQGLLCSPQGSRSAHPAEPLVVGLHRDDDDDVDDDDD